MTHSDQSRSFALTNGIVRFWIEQRTLAAKQVLCTAQVGMLVCFLGYKRTWGTFVPPSRLAANSRLAAARECCNALATDDVTCFGLAFRRPNVLWWQSKFVSPSFSWGRKTVWERLRSFAIPPTYRWPRESRSPRTGEPPTPTRCSFSDVANRSRT